MTTISVAKDFSRFPGGRFKAISKNSGEEFRDDFLLPALERTEGPVCIDLDGVRGYGSSFLEEVFGGLVRLKKWGTREDVDRKITIKTTSNSLLNEAEQYIAEAIEFVRQQ